jgi:hypothetical protein
MKRICMPHPNKTHWDGVKRATGKTDRMEALAAFTIEISPELEGMEMISYSIGDSGIDMKFDYKDGRDKQST